MRARRQANRVSVHQLSKSPDRRAVVSAIIGFHFEKRTAETTWKIAERSCLHRFAATAKPALTLFVGEAYAEGATPLLIISLFYAVTLIQTALSGLLVVLGETMLSLKLTALNSAVGVCLAQLLLPSLGTTGAAITRGVTMATILITTIIALEQDQAQLRPGSLLEKASRQHGHGLAVYGIQALYYSKCHLPFCVLIGGVIYLAMLRLASAVKPVVLELWGGLA